MGRLRMILAITLLLAAGTFATRCSISQQTRSAPKISISTGTTKLAAAGGSVLVTIRSNGSENCTLDSSPELPKFPINVTNCSTTRTITLPPNRGEAPIAWTFTVTNPVAGAQLSITEERRIRVSVLGDSILYQAKPTIDFLVETSGAVMTHSITYPGLTMCTLIPFIRRDIIPVHADLVIIEMLGTDFDQCAQVAPDHSPAWLAAFKTATETVVNDALSASSSTKVELVDAPTYMDQISGHSAVAQIYQEVSALHPDRVSYVNAGASVEGPQGQAVEYLPCLPKEISRGLCEGPTIRTEMINGTLVREIPVRGSDLVHFCPVNDASGKVAPPGCAVYSSGVFRFATALLNPALREFDLGPVSTSPPWRG